MSVVPLFVLSVVPFCCTLQYTSPLYLSSTPLRCTSPVHLSVVPLVQVQLPHLQTQSYHYASLLFLSYLHTFILHLSFAPLLCTSPTDSYVSRVQPMYLLTKSVHCTSWQSPVIVPLDQVQSLYLLTRSNHCASPSSTVIFHYSTSLFPLYYASSLHTCNRLFWWPGPTIVPLDQVQPLYFLASSNHCHSAHLWVFQKSIWMWFS